MMIQRNNRVLPDVIFTGSRLVGTPVSKSERRIADLEGLFADEAARKAMAQNTLVYEVFSYMPVTEGTEGGLFFGITHIYPGRVGAEYFMTKGHLHSKADRAEFYWGIEGEGLLLLTDEQGMTREERIFPGSLHYIAGYTAHRTVNTGNSTLAFGACWPSDAGHNYAKLPFPSITN